MSACEDDMVRRLHAVTRSDENEGLERDLARWNRCLATLTAGERVAWALEHLPGRHVVTSSFGAQSAVSLHLLTRQAPNIPVVVIDTGYLFPETYRFIDKLTEELELDIRVFRSAISPAWQEARHGQRWMHDLGALEEYNREVKVEPMREALDSLDVGTWFAGLRRTQAETRREVPFVTAQNGRYKVHPIADWDDRSVHDYLVRHDLPYHPLWEHGYLSIGDYHSTRSIHEVSDAAGMRFFGRKRECGLHEMELPPA